MVLLYPQQTLLQSDGKEYILLFYKYSTVSGKDNTFHKVLVLKEESVFYAKCHDTFFS